MRASTGFNVNTAKSLAGSGIVPAMLFIDTKLSNTVLLDIEYLKKSSLCDQIGLFWFSRRIGFAPIRTTCPD